MLWEVGYKQMPTETFQKLYVPPEPALRANSAVAGAIERTCAGLTCRRGSGRDDQDLLEGVLGRDDERVMLILAVVSADVEALRHEGLVVTLYLWQRGPVTLEIRLYIKFFFEAVIGTGQEIFHVL